MFKLFSKVLQTALSFKDVNLSMQMCVCYVMITFSSKCSESFSNILNFTTVETF